MLAIQKGNKRVKVEVHALPCRLHHNGHVNTRKRYNPERQADGTSTIYFRGRKLQGRTINLPEGYEGHILKATEKKLPQAPARPQVPSHDLDADADDEQEDEAPVEVNVAEDLGTFNGITIWNHGPVPSEAEDPYARAIQEWVGLAEAIHGIATETTASKTGS